MRPVKDIRGAADAVLTDAQITKPPLRMRDLARSLNIRLFADTKDMAGNVVFSRPLDSDGLMVMGASLTVIRFRTRYRAGRPVPQTRIRFTICHEIGHLVLHTDGVDGADVFADGIPDFDHPSEREADRFAAELLMPAAWVKELATTMSRDFLAARFHVSRQAMAQRLRELGLGRLYTRARTGPRSTDDDVADPLSLYPSVTGDADEDRILWERR